MTMAHQNVFMSTQTHYPIDEPTTSLMLQHRSVIDPSSVHFNEILHLPDKSQLR